MTRKLRPLTKGQADVIDAMAHYFVAADISKNVEGMEGFFKHWESTAQTDKQKQYVSALKRRMEEVFSDMAKSMKEEDNGTA